MKNKLNKIMLLYIPIALVIISICLPILTIYSENGEYIFVSRKVFGFHLIGGMFNEQTQVLLSSPSNIIFFILPLSIVFLNRISKNDLGLKITNFAISVATFIYFLLVPFNADKYLTDLYYGILDFKEAFGYFTIISLYFIYLIYFSVVLVKMLIKTKKDNQNNIVIEDKYEENIKQ